MAERAVYTSFCLKHSIYKKEKCTIENDDVLFHSENFDYLDVKGFFDFNETINSLVNSGHYMSR